MFTLNTTNIANKECNINTFGYACAYMFEGKKNQISG